jgi:uncharacterized YigZ family protein
MLTLAGRGSIEVEVRKSRFVAHAARVDDPAETLTFLDSVADPAATHNCWAWKIDDACRFDDDGEPGGTAGKPILSAIDGKGLDHAMVVVTRYFGGIKLGAGGLVRAYAGAAAKCIADTGTVEIEPRVELEISAGFEWTGEIYAALETSAARKLDEAFGTGGVRIRASVAESDFKGLRTTLRDATRGAATVRRLD